MLLVLSICGYPVDGLTQSTVLALNEVVKVNRYVAEGYLAVGLVVVLLVWMCGVCRHLATLIAAISDHFPWPGRRRGDERLQARWIATINSGGR
jgi:hypothetical protein